MTTPWDAEPGPTPPSEEPSTAAASTAGPPASAPATPATAPPPLVPSAPPAPSAAPPAPARYEAPDTTGPLPPIVLPADTAGAAGAAPSAPASPYAPPSYPPPTYAAPAQPSSPPFSGQPFASREGSPPLGPPTGTSWGGGNVPPTPPPTTPDDGSTKARGRGWMVVVAVVAAIALLTAGFVGGGYLKKDSNKTAAVSGTPTSSTQSTNQSTTPLVQGSGDEPVVAVASALSPAVVQIETQEGLGSGVIYDSSGLILTNQHVVGSATSVSVNLSDGNKLTGTVVGADPSSDIAVVRVDPTGKTLTAAKLATKDPAVGSVAVAIGSPFGLSGTVTAGVVSAVDRPVENGSNVAVNMIQTDAPINPGNSGGALANRNGEVIGINAEIYSQSGENNGIGFAIPIATAKSIADKITSGGSLARASLGVSIQNQTTGGSGAQVVAVTSGSGADKAGIKAGDVIVGIDGQQINTRSDLSAAIGTHQPGDTIKVEVQRDGQSVELTATLGTAS
ncbi:MAG: S1C family serine protease [Acidimicrobiales bacterium]